MATSCSVSRGTKPAGSGIHPSPNPKLHDPHEALKLAQKAVELEPDEGAYWNTLGVAHYRAKNWKLAVDALKKSVELVPSDLESFDTFFLAMAEWQLGNKDDARKWYSQA